MEYLMVFTLAFVAGGAGGVCAWFLARRWSRQEVRNVIIRYDRIHLPDRVEEIISDPRRRG